MKFSHERAQQNATHSPSPADTLFPALPRPCLWKMRFLHDTTTCLFLQTLLSSQRHVMLRGYLHPAERADILIANGSASLSLQTTFSAVYRFLSVCNSFAGSLIEFSAKTRL